MTIVEMNLTPEAQTTAPAPSAPPKKPSMLELFSEALTEMVERRVDARVNEVLANVATAKFMDTQLDERIACIVLDKLQEHNDEFEHTADIENSVEHAFRYAVDWESMVDERVKEQVAEMDTAPDEDKLHDMVREVLNEVTFTVSVD